MPTSIFTVQTPVAGNATDGVPYTLGTAWRTDTDGYVTHHRFRAPSNVDNGTQFVGLLFRITNEATGVELGRTQYLDGLVADDWNIRAFSAAIPVVTSEFYVTAYFTPDYFVLTEGVFASGGVTNAPLTAIQSGVPYGNGRIHVGDGYPEITSGASTNYFSDLIFDEVAPPTSRERWGIAL
jgi:hypothetical protein